MRQYNREEELLALQSISETLNRSNDTEEMLQDVLTQLLEVTGLPTGWVFLAGVQPTYKLAAKCGLPPALSWGGEAPMCSGRCWCLDRLWDGRLQRAVNIISCKRIEDAGKYKWGDTQHIEHHASIPLLAGDELIGILNVAAPNKRHFDAEELALLHAVAYQIGSAVKRTMLFQAERKRAEHLAKLSEVSRWIAETTESGLVSEQVVGRIGVAYGWQKTTLFLREGNELYLRAHYVDGRITSSHTKMGLSEANPVTVAIKQLTVVNESRNKISYKGLDEVGIGPFQSVISVPIYRSDMAYGVLLVTEERPDSFDANDVEVLTALAGQIALNLDKARLLYQRRELTRQEERHRLARDLHDSVSQTLFSLNVTARGAESLPQSEWALLSRTLKDIQSLSQEALKEMRSLILQLRPPGLELGIVTGLTQYGKRLGLTVRSEVKGLQELPQLVEEALWRIGQEALNNVSKHGHTNEVRIELLYCADKVTMVVTDQGMGFDRNDPIRHDHSSSGLGLLGMQERAALVGGFVRIETGPDQGTVVRVELPLAQVIPPSLQ